MAQKKTRKEILTSPAGIDREYTLPTDALRTRRNVDALYASLCIGRFLAHFGTVPPARRFTAEQEAEITERVGAEIERRHALMMEAHARGNLPQSYRVVVKGKGKKKTVTFVDNFTPEQRAYHVKHVKPLAFKSEDVRAEIEAEYV